MAGPPPSRGGSSAPTGFFGVAPGMARSPLGFLGLCLVLVYAVAGLVFAVGRNVDADSARLLVWFIIGFPVLVLAAFVVLIAFFRDQLIWPSDFPDPAQFTEWEKALRRTEARTAANARKIDVIAEVTPVAIDWQPEDVDASASAVEAATEATAAAVAARSDDPQKGKWGEKPGANGYELRAGPIRPLKTDPDYFRIPLEVRSTVPNRPLTGTVTFHLHDTFTPDVEEVEAENGAARLELVGYGAFTVGAQLPDGTKLELDLSAPEVDAPAAFKQR